MNLITQAELARRLGITRQAVRDACLKKRIYKVKGKIDLDADSTKAYMAASAASKVTGGRGKKRPPKSESLESVTTQADLGAIMSVEEMGREELDKQKLREQILGMQVKTARERKELVSTDAVAKVFAKLAAIDTSEFHPLADKIAGDVAALCGLEDNETRVKIKALIAKPVFRALKHRKRLMDDYLKKMGG